MKREIKFRGLRTDGKGWVIGDIATYWTGKPMIMPKCYFATCDFGGEDKNGKTVLEKELALGGFVDVIPESVGQYTGLKDKNGVEIYEGDILINTKEEKGIVVWYEAGFHIECKRRNNSIFYIPLTAGMLKNKLICGNIYEHPNLP